MNNLVVRSTPINPVSFPYPQELYEGMGRLILECCGGLSAASDFFQIVCREDHVPSNDLESYRQARIFTSENSGSRHPLGIALFLPRGQGQGFVEYVGVSPNFRHHGVGRALIASIQRHVEMFPDLRIQNLFVKIPPDYAQLSSFFMHQGFQQASYSNGRSGLFLCPVHSC